MSDYNTTEAQHAVPDNDKEEFEQQLQQKHLKQKEQAEGGGQIGDSGHIEGPNGTIQIDDTRAPISDLTVHIGRVLKGVMKKLG